ncbi:unnamed protein product [Peronospora belbahrii]|uniref:TFIIS N-terminal domain-containing protein n=1 Tax=Peronospora belbahrii TaxID=622444 RepID=A0ABN8DAS0_9STRA|nr:unnamed protein product [Peronospora belbahrii]
MKFLSAPHITLYDDDQDKYPPPIKDTTTSRYLGVNLRFHGKKASKTDEKWIDQDKKGLVKCFLPFADQYLVEYEDGSTEKVSESAVIDGMIALIKSPFFSSPDPTKKCNGDARIWKNDGYVDNDKLGPLCRKRQRVETTSSLDVQEIPSGSVAVVEDMVDDDEQDDDVVFVDHMEVIANTDREMETEMNSLDITSSASGSSATRENSLEMASHPLKKPMQVNRDDAMSQDDVVKIQRCHQKELNNKELAIDTMPVDTVQHETQKEVPFYIVDTKPHVAVKPLPKRTMAFELLRTALLNLLDRREASAVKIALQYDLLRNSDVRDRDAVIRFMDAGGLLVLNHLLNLFATEVLDDDDIENKEDSITNLVAKMRQLMERDAELLYVLKLVAMLPTPSRDQVIASNIGKTINYLSKTHGPPGRRRALPKCISALAKWVKTSWIKNIPSASKPVPKASVHTQHLLDRPQQQARRGGRGGSFGRRSLQWKRRQLPPSHRSQRQVSSSSEMLAGHHVSQDNTLIPRLSRPKQVAQSQRSVAAHAPSQLPVPRCVRGNLKPDWMRQRENLSRSRFCIDDTTNVDTRLCQGSRVQPIKNAIAPTSQAPTTQDQNPDQHEDAGGPDGVYGRAQRLRFGKRWSIQKFRRKDPPGALRQPLESSYSVSSYRRSEYSNQHMVHVPPVPHSSREPRSILRRVSRYNDEPVIDGPGR